MEIRSLHGGLGRQWSKGALMLPRNMFLMAGFEVPRETPGYAPYYLAFVGSQGEVAFSKSGRGYGPVKKK